MTASAEVSVIAIVHFAGGVSFCASAACPDALSKQLAEYVLGRCDDVLWPDVAGHVRALLDQGSLTEAIALYFEHTGSRWERERLELVTTGNGGYGVPDAERMADAGH